MAPEAEGSNPSTHPNLRFFRKSVDESENFFLFANPWCLTAPYDASYIKILPGVKLFSFSVSESLSVFPFTKGFLVICLPIRPLSGAYYGTKGLREMKKDKTMREETIVGYVVPSEWDSDDNVVSIAISTEEDDYLVEMNKLGEELFDFLDEDVEVTGVVREDRDGTKRIRITSYEVLEDVDDDYEEEDDYNFDDEDEE